jgi:hypothetical protein
LNQNSAKGRSLLSACRKANTPSGMHSYASRFIFHHTFDIPSSWGSRSAFNTLPSLKRFVVGTPGYASLHLAIVLGWAAIPVLTHPPRGDLNSTTTWFPTRLLSSYSITMLDTFKADALI